jgi:predicted glycogen debranching enzyme
VAAGDRRALDRAIQAILEGYARGTRYGITADGDGLLRAGVPGVQLTWMDAKVGDWVVTPRVGKPVEIQALWINALRIGGGRWDALRERAMASFERRFWDEERGALHDVVDVDHVPGAVDASIRPNQLLAVGGLPWPLVTGRRARRIVDLAERELWTPLGPRSLAPAHPDYAPHYRGDPVMRDGAYHQGTVWPWLAGAFVDAWIRARRGTPAARAEARRRFVEPLLAHLDEAGVGHVSEVADADAPHVPGGCPFQAWSVGELLRIERVILPARPRLAAV